MSAFVYYILENGQPKPVSDIAEWCRWFEANATARHVADDEPAPGVRVSTVFLGLDHNPFADGPPLIFETLVFGGPLDDEMDRYSTTEQAIDGHNAMCERVRKMAALTS